ncbi:hypothetical protein SUDANB96_00006 [Streptomyces sp. enrichment culture]
MATLEVPWWSEARKLSFEPVTPEVAVRTAMVWPFAV